MCLLKCYPFVKTCMQVSYRTSSFGTVSVGWTRTNFRSLRSSGFRISAVSLIPFENTFFLSKIHACNNNNRNFEFCQVQAQPETVQKVSKIVRKQLALTPETELTPETKFSALGADSLDTVRIQLLVTCNNVSQMFVVLMLELWFC